nr:MAG TPA: hypothetical protein [Caudoviricetes sp.]
MCQRRPWPLKLILLCIQISFQREHILLYFSTMLLIEEDFKQNKKRSQCYQHRERSRSVYPIW